MEFQRYSKSFDHSASICPWKEDQHRNHGVERRKSPAAGDSIVAHELRDKCASGRMSYEECLEWAATERTVEIFRAAVANDHYWDVRDRFEYEREVRITGKGKLRTTSRGRTYCICRLDRVGRLPDGTILAEDLKGNLPGWESDSEVERTVSVLSAQRLYPDDRVFRFDYFFCRSGKRISTNYEFDDVGVIITGADGTQIRWEGTDPLFTYVRTRVDHFRALEPAPTPGAHCERFFGQPCQFLGNGCPLGDRVRDYLITEGTDDLPIPTQPEIVSPENVLAAFVNVLRNGEPEHISPEIASLALQAAIQLKHASGSVESTLRQWSKEHGPIAVGQDRYGYGTTTRPGLEEDIVPVLRMLYGSGGWDAVARAVNLSPSSLKRLSRRQFGNLAQTVLDVCGDDVASEEWTAMRFEEKE